MMLPSSNVYDAGEVWSGPDVPHGWLTTQSPRAGDCDYDHGDTSAWAMRRASAPSLQSSRRETYDVAAVAVGSAWRNYEQKTDVKSTPPFQSWGYGYQTSDASGSEASPTRASV